MAQGGGCFGMPVFWHGLDPIFINFRRDIDGSGY